MSADYTARYAALKSLFLELIELPEPDREQRLSTIARSDPDLATQVAAQLKAAVRPMALLDRQDATSAPHIANYRILRELGRGGMGVVWLAEREIGDLRQRVAIKQLGHARWNADDMRRFERERRILSQLDHPGIVMLVDAGADDVGLAWMATQYVEGQRLDHWLDTARPALRERVGMLATIAGVVAHAHSRLVVHRDLKPANILVDRDKRPRLLDFGIARVLHEEALTIDGASQMTLRYAAPEQLETGAAAFGTGVDIYALGVLLYEMLAGQSPYRDTRSPSALIHAILHEEPRPPSRSGDADADLDAVCLKAMRKNPTDRYATVSDLQADLQRWLAGEPVQARRGERGYALSMVLRRHRWMIASVLLLVTLSIGAAGYHLAEVRSHLARTAEERDRVVALAGYFNELFQLATPADTDRGDISARELLERSVAQLTTDETRAPLARATLLSAAGEALAFLGHMERARDAQQLAVILFSADSEVHGDALAKAHIALATARQKTGDAPGAQREIDAALALFERGWASDPDNHLTARQVAATYAENRGDVAAAREGYRRIAEIAQTRLDTPRGLNSYLSAQSNLGISYTDAGDAVTGEKVLQDALATAAELDSEKGEQTLILRSFLGRALYQQRKLDEARVVMDALMRDARAHYGPDDPWLQNFTNTYATLALLDGRADEAAALLDINLAATIASYGEDHPYAWAERAARANASLFQGRWEDAIQRFEAVLAWREAQGMGTDVASRFRKAQIAYARCRLDGSANNRQAFHAALADNEGWHGWAVWIQDDWRAACPPASTTE